eukprot:scaffold2753_cov115-Isochrysis_galbana.AAC.3
MRKIREAAPIPETTGGEWEGGVDGAWLAARGERIAACAADPHLLEQVVQVLLLDVPRLGGQFSRAVEQPRLQRHKVTAEEAEGGAAAAVAAQHCEQPRGVLAVDRCGHADRQQQNKLLWPDGTGGQTNAGHQGAPSLAEPLVVRIQIAHRAEESVGGRGGALAQGREELATRLQHWPPQRQVTRRQAVGERGGERGGRRRVRLRVHASGDQDTQVARLEHTERRGRSWLISGAAPAHLAAAPAALAPALALTGWPRRRLRADVCMQQRLQHG